MSTVTVLIPHWNRRTLLASLLKRLREQTYQIDEVLVVDNGSEDGSPEVAREYGARVLAMGSNAGFSRAVNRGLTQVHTEYVAIVNNDVAPAQDWLQKLVEALDAPWDGRPAWFASGKLLSTADSRRLDGSFDLVCRGGCAWRAGSGRPDGPLWEKARRIVSAPLTATLVRMELFRRLGGLDEELESYLEDVDFGIRCAIAGYSGLYVPEAVAFHEGSATFGRWHPETVRRISRNQLLLIAKHYPKNWLRRYGWNVAVAQLLWGLLAVRHGAGAAWLRGKWQALRKFRAVRRIAPDPAGLDMILTREEQELHALQQATGFDLYWRIYFALTGGHWRG
ncbi:MAG: glycosyltransferase family 2 protein [Bryobacteraceae bacterium]|nr:glycosyltransferase family 2 protein [Bryobacteraceae bacterium]